MQNMAKPIGSNLLYLFYLTEQYGGIYYYHLLIHQKEMDYDGQKLNINMTERKEYCSSYDKNCIKANMNDNIYKPILSKTIDILYMSFMNCL